METNKFKGALKDVPLEIVEKMCEYQVKQGNKRNTWEMDKGICKGFVFSKTNEGQSSTLMETQIRLL